MHVQTCSGRNSIIPLMRRPNTDSTPNKPVTLPRNQLLIRYVVTSPVRTVTIRRYGTRWRYSCVPTLTGFQLGKKFPALYGTRRFTTAFTRARHLSPSRTSLQSKTFQPMNLRTILTLILPRSRRERYGSTLLPATREQHDQNCTQSH